MAYVHIYDELKSILYIKIEIYVFVGNLLEENRYQLNIPSIWKAHVGRGIVVDELSSWLVFNGRKV